MTEAKQEINIAENPVIQVKRHGDETSSINFTLKITNNGKLPWNGVAVSAILLAGDETPLAEYKITVDAQVDVGEHYDAGGSFYVYDAQLLAERTKDLKVIANVATYTTIVVATIEKDIPERAYSPIVIAGDALSKPGCVKSCAVWISEPDADKEVSIEVRIAYANISDENITELKGRAQLLSKAGHDIDEFDRSAEVNSGAVGILSLSTMSKANKIKKGKIVIEVSESKTQTERCVVITDNAAAEHEGNGQNWAFPG